MENTIALLEKLCNQFPWIALVLIFYFFIRYIQKYCKLSHIVEIENIRNQHQKDMFDKNKEKEMKLLEMKNSHDLEILKEKKI